MSRALRYVLRLVATALVLALAVLIGVPDLLTRIVQGPRSVDPGVVEVLAHDDDRGEALEVVALGDSYMSGEGTGRYLEGTDIADNRCHRSDLAYPVLVAERLRVEPVPGWDGVRLDFAACSGAVTTNIGTTFEDVDAQEAVEQQYQAQPLQMDTLAAHRDADVVVVGVGGNDAGFAEAVMTCSGKQSDRDCADLAGPWLEVFGEFQTPEALAIADSAALLPQKLRNLLDEARRTAPEARYYITTYPNPFSAETCPALGMNRAEVAFVRDVFLVKLNRWIDFVARIEGFEVIDLTDAFEGEGLCAHGDEHGSAMNAWRPQRNAEPSLAPKPWLQGSVHPTADGHELIAQIVEREVRADLAEPAPNVVPDDTVGAVPPGPPPDEFSLVLGSFCVTAASSSPCEIPGEIPAVPVETLQDGPGQPPVPGPGEPIPPPGSPEGPPAPPGAATPGADLTEQPPPPPDPGTADGDPPTPPPLFSTMEPNECTAEAPFANFVLRPDGPLTVTAAVPGSKLCYRVSTGAWLVAAADERGELSIDTRPAVSGVGGSRQVVYESSVAGDWVWRYESPGPTTPDSDFNFLEAWIGSKWFGAWVLGLSKTQGIVLAVLIGLTLIVALEAGITRRRRARRPPDLTMDTRPM